MTEIADGDLDEYCFIDVDYHFIYNSSLFLRTNMYYPSIIETTGRSSKAFDLPTKLLQDRIIFLGGTITADSANFTIMQLLWLDADNPEKDIDLYINSPGGSVYDGLGIIDVINHIAPKVNTIGIGLCASMGATLLACGTGLRRATKNTRVMIHSLNAATDGTFHDIAVDYKEYEYLQNKMLTILAQASKGKTTLKTLQAMTQRDYFMDPETCQKLGLIDSIV